MVAEADPFPEVQSVVAEVTPEVAEDIAAAGCVPGCGVVEVGPGIGALTVQLARRAASCVQGVTA